MFEFFHHKVNQIAVLFFKWYQFYNEIEYTENHALSENCLKITF